MGIMEEGRRGGEWKVGELNIQKNIQLNQTIKKIHQKEKSPVCQSNGYKELMGNLKFLETHDEEEVGDV